MRTTAAARRYSRALFSLAKESQRIAEVRSQIDRMASLFESSPELSHALFRPLHPVLERRGVLASVCDRAAVEPVVKNFFSYLIDQRRLVDFDAIRAEYARLADLDAGRTTAEVVCAAPLREEQRQRLERARPETLGQASRLEGMTPSAVSLLLIHLRKRQLAKSA